MSNKKVKDEKEPLLGKDFEPSLKNRSWFNRHVSCVWADPIINLGAGDNGVQVTMKDLPDMSEESDKYGHHLPVFIDNFNKRL